MAYELLPTKLSHDVIVALETLLEGARSGDVTGLAYVAVVKRMRYITDVAGVCYRNPTFARGCVITLSDEIGHLIHQRDPESTR